MKKSLCSTHKILNSKDNSNSKTVVTSENCLTSCNRVRESNIWSKHVQSVVLYTVLNLNNFLLRDFFTHKVIIFLNQYNISRTVVYNMTTFENFD